MQTIKVASSKMYEKNILKYLNKNVKKFFYQPGCHTVGEIKRKV
jgi:sialic acid synthase SpsE